ncbi:MAG: hypothetical protein F4039_08960 [Gammaproteobacteria bacterium]|nr:hypothetical protein [Gammaproteobacteria bacterium]
MESVKIADYSQFLYSSNGYTDFNAEGIKTISLQFGISTGEIDIEFLNEEKTEALFRCAATNRQGDTASSCVYQSQTEYGKENRFWIEKGSTRARAKAQRELLPVALLKQELQRAITAGEAEKSNIIEAQRACTQAYENYNGELSKREFIDAHADKIGLDMENWTAQEWKALSEEIRESSKGKTTQNC